MAWYRFRVRQSYKRHLYLKSLHQLGGPQFDWIRKTMNFIHHVSLTCHRPKTSMMDKVIQRFHKKLRSNNFANIWFQAQGTKKSPFNSCHIQSVPIHWHRILKLVSNSACLFTFWLFCWGNLLKTKLQTCKSVLIEFAYPSSKK